jgi:prophage antirepressor-like protein
MFSCRQIQLAQQWKKEKTIDLITRLPEWHRERMQQLISDSKLHKILFKSIIKNRKA